MTRVLAVALFAALCGLGCVENNNAGGDLGNATNPNGAHKAAGERCSYDADCEHNCNADGVCE